MNKDLKRAIDITLIVILALVLFDFSNYDGRNVKKLQSNAVQEFRTLRDALNISPTDPLPVPEVALTPEYTPERSIGGGGGSTDVENIGSIKNIRICSSEPDKYGNCNLSTEDGFKINDTIYVYWQVESGVGCCATYFCDYEEWAKRCLTNDWRLLYVPYLDGEILNITPGNYTCENITPWNWVSFSPNESRSYELKIKQRACGPRYIGYFTRDFEVRA